MRLLPKLATPKLATGVAPREAVYTALTYAVVLGFVLFCVTIALGFRPTFSAGGYVIGEDFSNTWMSGRAALAGHAAQWFEPSVYNVAMRRIFGPAYPWQNWSYPPHIMLVTWLFGLLPYWPALVLWTIAGTAVYVRAVAGGEVRTSRFPFVLFAPAAICNVLVGQNGYFTAALMIGALSQLDRRPALAGALFGLLTFKPQLGLLVPFMLLVTRRWVCLAAAAATAIVVFVATGAIFGFGVWGAYLRVAMPVQSYILQQAQAPFVLVMPSVFMNARALGLPLAVDWLLQGLAATMALAAALWTYRRKRDPDLSRATFMTASLVATPYVFPYDTVMLVWVAVLLRKRRGGPIWDDVLALSVWLLPAIAFGLGQAGLPVSSLVLIVLLLRLVWLNDTRRLDAAAGSQTPALPVPSENLACY
jgi:hypothetical protein